LGSRRLLETARFLNVLARDRARLSSYSWSDRVEVVQADPLRPETLPPALSGVATAFYLIHSMMSGPDFRRRDITAARNFARAARQAKVGRIVYLGGLSVLPKFGVRLVLPRAFDTLTWLGRGPHESYVDRKRSADVGLYSGKGLLVVTDGTYSIGAHHNTADDYDQAGHIHKVVPRDEVYLCIDAAHTGLGGASCGPRPLNEYILNAAPMRFRYSLRPATQDRATRARIQLPNLEAPLLTRDKGGMVRIESSVAGKVEYRLDNGSWKTYTGPFEHPEEGTLEARVRLDNGLSSDIARVEFDKIVPLLDLDKSTWKVTHADSVEPGEGEVRHAIDNDPATFWHTNWSSTREKHPHEIRIDLGEAVKLLGLPSGGSVSSQTWAISCHSLFFGTVWSSADLLVNCRCRSSGAPVQVPGLRLEKPGASGQSLQKAG